MNVIEIKRLVRERDGNRCVECGMTAEEHRAKYGRALEVHRVTPGSAYAVDQSCVTLCRNCHGPKPRTKYGRNPQPVVKISREAYRAAKAMAAWKGIRLADYLAQVVREVAVPEIEAIAAHVRQRP